MTTVERSEFIRNEKRKFKVPEFLQKERENTGFDKVLREEMERLRNGRRNQG